MSDRLPVPFFVRMAALLTIGVCTLIVTGRVPAGIPGQWTWERQPLGPLPPTLWAVVSSLAAVAAACFVVSVGRKVPIAAWKAAACLAVLILVSMSLSLSLLGMEPDPAALVEGGSLEALWHRPPLRRALTSLISDARNDVALGYFGQSLRVDSPSAYLRDYAGIISSGALPQRVRTHPPGAVLYFWAVRRALVASGLLDAPGTWLFGRDNFRATVARINTVRGPRLSTIDATAGLVGALGLLFIGACTVIPAYLLARLVAGPASAMAAAALTAFIPSLVLFVPGIDQAVAFLGTTAVWFFVLACKRASVPLSLAGGFALFLASMITIGAAALFVLMAAYTVGEAGAKWGDRARRAGILGRLGRALGAALAGVVVPFILLKLAYGYQAIAVAVNAKAVQGAIMRDWGRGYAPWLVVNLVDFAVFLSPAVAFAAGAWMAGRWRRACRQRRLARADVLALAAFATLAIVDLSGTARGEVGRIWCLFMPYFAGLAAFRCTWPGQRGGVAFVVTLAGLQVLQCVCTQSYLDLVKPSW